MTLNRYIYGLANPVYYTDPTGLFSICQVIGCLEADVGNGGGATVSAHDLGSVPIRDQAKQLHLSDEAIRFYGDHVLEAVIAVGITKAQADAANQHVRNVLSNFPNSALSRLGYQQQLEALEPLGLRWADPISGTLKRLTANVVREVPFEGGITVFLYDDDSVAVVGLEESYRYTIRTYDSVGDVVPGHVVFWGGTLLPGAAATILTGGLGASIQVSLIAGALSSGASSVALWDFDVPSLGQVDVHIRAPVVYEPFYWTDRAGQTWLWSCSQVASYRTLELYPNGGYADKGWRVIRSSVGKESCGEEPYRPQLTKGAQQ